MMTKLLSEKLASICEELQQVKKAVEKSDKNLCSRCCSSQSVDAKPSASRSLKLHFVGTLPDEIMTLDNIKSKDGGLKVELQDSSGSRVAVGPESCVKIKIFVLDGDFDVEEGDDWTAEEFAKNVAQPRKDKGSLLKGKCEISMKMGLAEVNDIVFNDNSKSVTKNGCFRIGAQVVKGLPKGVEVKEAVSKAFQVKERRGKFYRGSRTLLLEESPDRLKHIGPTFLKKLVAKNIRTVQDFLRLYHTDSKVLKDILNLPHNKWLELVKDAESCQLTQTVYQYSDNDSGVTLELDCVFKITRMFNGTISKPYAALDDSEKEQVNEVRRRAYEKLQESHFPIVTPKQHEFESTSDNPCPSTQHLDAMETDMDKGLIGMPVDPVISLQQGGHNFCSIQSNQTHQARDEHRSPSSTPCTSTAQHPDAMAANEAKSPITRPILDPTVSMKRTGQENCSFLPQQKCQGQEGLTYPNSLGHSTEVQNMTPKNEEHLPIKQELPQPQVPLDQPGQHQARQLPLDGDVLHGTKALFSQEAGISYSQDQSQLENYPTSEIPYGDFLHVEAYLLDDSNQEAGMSNAQDQSQYENYHSDQILNDRIRDFEALLHDPSQQAGMSNPRDQPQCKNCPTTQISCDGFSDGIGGTSGMSNTQDPQWSANVAPLDSSRPLNSGPHGCSSRRRPRS